MTMFSKAFVLAAGERAVKTAAQTAAASTGTTAAIQHIDWGFIGGTVVTATLLSLLTSIGSSTSEAPGPSLVSAERLQPLPPPAPHPVSAPRPAPDPQPAPLPEPRPTRTAAYEQTPAERLEARLESVLQPRREAAREPDPLESGLTG